MLEKVSPRRMELGYNLTQLVTDHLLTYICIYNYIYIYISDLLTYIYIYIYLCILDPQHHGIVVFFIIKFHNSKPCSSRIIPVRRPASPLRDVTHQRFVQIEGFKGYKNSLPMTDPWCCYMVTFGSHGIYTPVMLTLIYQHHGSVMGNE